MSWLDSLEKEFLDNPELSHTDFLYKYEDCIPGPNRDAKRKKVKRYLEKLRQPLCESIRPKKEKIYENNFEPSVIDLNIEKQTVIFGLIGDTHYNSKYCQMTHLHSFYDLCKQQGITTVYHTGDIDDGENMRPGHTYENYTQGADEHINEIIKNYPHVEGIDTYFITGNHDASYRKHCGLDIGRQIEKERDDLHCLGRDLAVVNITPKVSMMLRHPWTGSAYALSYRPQKMIEAMEAGCVDKPNILCIGHFHKMEYLYYHGVHTLQTGCFQSATPFTVGKGISVSLGGWIVSIRLDSDGEIETITPTAVTYANAIKNDYKNYDRF